ncbi:MAG: GFA family protein [Myxococcota bacterium]
MPFGKPFESDTADFGSLRSMAGEMIAHTGSCHCRSVVFEVHAPSDLVVYECNCSICSRTGFLHLIVEADCFRILSGESFLTSYKFGTKTADHLFCRKCGVKSFYVPRSHPNGYSVNIRCLDREEITSVDTRPFDGQNWEENRRHLDS